jgi:prepilin-type N-terminal cleavage/methylation domain-containing protein
LSRRRWSRLWTRLLREEAGFNLVELLTAMGILAIVMSSLTVVLVSATKADIRMNQSFQAQTQARVALDRFRREGHAACRAEPAGPATSITLTFVTLGTCPASGGRQVSWCTIANGTSRYGLFRATGATCDATGLKLADYLTHSSAFNYQTTIFRRPKIAINLPVNPNPQSGRGTYTLDGDVVLRNASRATS